MADRDGASIGTARMDIKVDISDLQAAIATAKSSTSSMTASAKAAYESLNAVERRRVDTLLRQADTVGMNREQQLAYNASLKASQPLLDEVTRRIQAQRAAAAAASKDFGISQAQYNAALRNVPAQITDIFVGLQGGQAPLTVLLQQGGQLKDMFGGVVPAAKALGGELLGLVNIWTLSATALAAFAVAQLQGQQRLDAFRQTLILNGRESQASLTDLMSMTQRLDDANSSWLSASEAVNAVANSAFIARKQWELVGEAATSTSKVTGEAVTDLIKEYDRLGEAPAKASAELNKQYQYLTAATYQRIKELEDQGRTEEAADLAISTRANSAIERAKRVAEEYSLLKQLMIEIIPTAKELWSWLAKPMLTYQSPAGSASVQIASLERQLEGLDALKANPVGQYANQQAKGNTAWLDEFNARYDGIKAKLDSIRGTAVGSVIAPVTAMTPEVQKAIDSVSALVDKGKSKAEQYKEAIVKYEESLKKIRAQDPDSDLLKAPAQATAREAIRKQFEDKAASNLATRIGNAGLDSDIKEIAERFKTLTSDVANAERVLQAQRAAGLVSESGYYSKRAEMVREDARLEVESLKAQNDRLAKQKSSGADAIVNAQKIGENRQRINQIEARAQADLTVLAAQEQATFNKRTLAMRAFVGAQEDYLAVANRQWQRSTLGMTMSSRDQEYLSGINGIEDRFADARRELERARDNAMTVGAWGSDDEKDFDAKIAALERFLGTTTAAYAKAFDDQNRLQENWSTGAQKAMADYAESARNIASQTQTLFSNAFGNMEDALVNFAATGKLSFSDFANSLIKDLIRIQIRSAMTSALGSGGGLMSLLSIGASFFGGGSGSGAVTSAVGGYGGMTTVDLAPLPHANGGVHRSPGLSAYSGTVVSKPTIFPFAKGGVPNLGLMGEEKPEAIFPLTQTSSGKLGVRAEGAGGGGQHINYAPVIQIDGRLDKAETAVMLQKVLRANNAELLDKMKRGVEG